MPTGNAGKYRSVFNDFKANENTVDSLISGHHRGNNFCQQIGGVRLLQSLILLTLCGLGSVSLKVLNF